MSIDRLTVDLGGARILDEVSLTVPAGCFATLLGPSGSGKTTTLNVLAGFTDPGSGDVRIGGRSLTGVPPHRREIGVVFQNYALFPHLSVGRNIEFPLLARKVDRATRRERVAEALRLVHLPDVADRSVRSLSGGQQQRIALARALVFAPQLLLLDEPLAALDKQLREAMQLELKRIQRETGTTTIAVTHDQVEALSMSDIVAIMQDGKIVQVGSPEEVYRRPATRFVAGFLGEANLLPVVDGKTALFGNPVDGSGTTVLRPEDLELTAADHPGTVAATVTEVVYQGARLRLTVAADGTPIVVSAVPGDLAHRPEIGDAVGVRHRGGELRALADA
ncbi:ABC transporter ATP-binding protein [Cryptosporangium aurantiacum]|uniref:ABC transporter ATP-binding protein n=1 Tax=Cryptosporangium aurantiacum TaxID=134849 RepID=UPI001C49FEA2|nr:ABC transporter ATP-binding protein [Cryptosporangium aurantiacum]